MLSGLGIVGALLLGGALLALVAAAGRALFASREARGAAAAGLGVFAYWFLHASVDWFWAFFALTGSALAALAMAASLGAAPAPTGEEGVEAAIRRAHGRLRRRRPGHGAPGPVDRGPLALGARGEPRRRRLAPGSDAAFDALDRAETLNPLSTVPGATAGTIALRLDRTGEAEGHFREVLADDPENAYAALELGLIASAGGS